MPLYWALQMGEESAYSQGKMTRAQTQGAGEGPRSKETGEGDWHCSLAQLELEREGHEVEPEGCIS